MKKTDQVRSAQNNLQLAKDKLQALDQRRVSKRSDEYKYWSDRANRLELFLDILAGLQCRRHNGYIAFGKCEMQNGKFHVMARCSDCSQRLGQWISKESIPADILDNLPVFETYLDHKNTCEVCGKNGVELHHWAPKELFPDNFENWPKSNLCPDCHQKWHNAVTNPFRLLRRQKGLKDEHGKAA